MKDFPGEMRVHSDLDHWLPRGRTDTEIMQSTADCHHKISHALFGEANDFLDHTASFDTAVYVLDAYSSPRDQTVGLLLLWRELHSTRLLGGHDGGDSLECEGLKAQILQKLAALWQGIGGAVGNLFIMPPSLNRIAQKEDVQILVYRASCKSHSIESILTERRASEALLW